MRFPMSKVAMCLFAGIAGIFVGLHSAQAQSGACSTGACVATYHNDPARDGVNPNETVLTPSLFPSTSAANFGLLTPSSGGASGAVDGLIYAQPLYLSAVNMASSGCSGTQNIVLAATMNNSLYAFTWTYSTTASSYSFTLTQCWKLNLNEAGEFATPFTAVGVNKSGTPCNNTIPQIGIVSTPVIDTTVTPPVLYAVTADQTASVTYTYRLHAINVSTGAEYINGTSAPYNLSGVFNSKTSAKFEMQRPGLALFDGSSGTANVYVSFGAFCDVQPYSGYVAGLTYNYSSQSFSTVGPDWVFDTQSGSTDQNGGIWTSGAAPAVDSAGNLYVAVGNGNWNGTTEFGESVVKLATTSSGLATVDYYTPNDYADLNNSKTAVTVCSAHATSSCPSANKLTFPKGTNDLDFGAGGATLISPAGITPSPCGTDSELVVGGKEGVLYGVCHSTQTGTTLETLMGGLDGCGYKCTTNSNPTVSACTESAAPGNGAIAQCFQGANVGENQSNGTHNIFSSAGIRSAPTFWAGTAASPENYLYVAGISAPLEAYQISSATGLFNAAGTPETTPTTFPYPSTIASLSWNGSESSTALLWAINSSGYGIWSTSLDKATAAKPETLMVYDPIPSGNPPVLKELWESSGSNAGPGAVKWTVPTVAGGLVFVGGGTAGYAPGPPGEPGVNCTAAALANTTTPTVCGGQLSIYGKVHN